MDITVYGVVKLLEDIKFEITCIAYFDSKDENFAELKYMHIMTGQECDSLDQVFVGWSEQDKKDNLKWDELVRRIKLNDNLLEYMAENEIGKYYYEYTIDAFGRIGLNV